jgi:hypothetical protein
MPEPASKRDSRRSRRSSAIQAASFGRQTRRPLVPWDRLKFMLALVLV